MTEPVIPGVLEAQSLEPRSSAEVKENAKGEPACSIKGYSNDMTDLETMALEVVRVFKEMRAALVAL